MKILKYKCPHCKKEIQSLYESQAKFNFEEHLKYCKQRLKKEGEDENKV